MASHSFLFFIVLQLCLLVNQVLAQNAETSLEGNVNACSLGDNGANYKTNSKIRVKGWVDQPNYRGTFDILWVTLVTIVVSTYTMLCLNVPAPNDSYLKLVSRRFLWMLLGIVGLNSSSLTPPVSGAGPNGLLLLSRMTTHNGTCGMPSLQTWVVLSSTHKKASYSL